MFLGFWIKKSSWPPLTENHIVWIYLLFLCYSFGASFTNFNDKPICEHNNWRILPFYFWWRFLYIVLIIQGALSNYLLVCSLPSFSSLSLRLIVTIFFCAYCIACFLLSVLFHPILTHSIILTFINFFSIFHTMFFNYIGCIGSFFCFFFNIIINFITFAVFTCPCFLLTFRNFFSCKFFLTFLMLWWFEGCPSPGLV